MDVYGAKILTSTERHPVVIGEVLRECPQLTGNLFHDAHTAVLMREHGIQRIYTCDQDFRRFAFLDPVDPAQEMR